MSSREGHVYEGGLKDGVRSGEGKMSRSEGAVYEGGWVDGMRSGKGRFQDAQGNVYEGDFDLFRGVGGEGREIFLWCRRTGSRDATTSSGVMIDSDLLFVGLLEEDDDVQSVHSNFDISENVLAEIS